MKIKRMSFGQRLRQLREKAGMSQAELARRAEIARTGIVQYEADQKQPSWGYLQRIADVLGVSTEALRA